MTPALAITAMAVAVTLKGLCMKGAWGGNDE